MIQLEQSYPNTFRWRQNDHKFPGGIFKYIFNRSIYISFKISLKFVPKCLINNIPAVVQIMAWHWPGNNHYLNHWWLDYRHIYVWLSLNEWMQKLICKEALQCGLLCEGTHIFSFKESLHTIIHFKTPTFQLWKQAIICIWKNQRR